MTHDHSISTLFYRQPRITILVICLIVVSGLSAYVVLPRMEDPLMTERVAMINTIYPGADAERVEALVTEKLEEEFQEIDEINDLRSFSSAGISTITIELRDDVYAEEAGNVWSRIRDKLDDTTPQLPEGVLEPEFVELKLKAYALILGVTWDGDGSPGEHVSYAVLRRMTEQLEQRLRSIAGTEIIDTFGDPDEEIIVEVDVARLAGYGLTVADVAQQINASDSKMSAGLLRGNADLLVEIDGELNSLDRIGRIPIRSTSDGRFVVLSDIASIRRTIVDPPSSLAFVDGNIAVSLAVTIRNDQRIDHWTAKADAAVEEFSEALPTGISLHTVFRQNDYVASRLSGLMKNLFFGAAAVALVVLVMMGWRSALIVSSSLPLSALMVLSGMRFMDIPIHQMSVTGLIVALGLLIDNAIVVVDDVSVKLRAGKRPLEAVGVTVSHLAVPLLGSTLTTALAFGPIALMPGPAGEFVGSIALSVILAIFSSLFLALTIVPAMTALGIRSEMESRPNGWWQSGLSILALTNVYRRSLAFVFARPPLGLVIGLSLPLAGFVGFSQLPEQFFPPADRDQVHIEVEFPSQTSISENVQIIGDMRTELLRMKEISQVTWYAGESAPTFYYNVVPRRKNTSNYAQAIVQLTTELGTADLIRQLQKEMDSAYPTARILVRQLEQGPPFDAPVEVRLFGPDIDSLRRLGEEIRLVMSEIPEVIHTRSDMSEVVAKVSVSIPEEEAHLAGLTYGHIAAQLSSSLEGATGGSILEETEELPVRVRVANDVRADLSAIASTDLLAKSRDGIFAGIPLSAFADITVVPATAAMTRINGRRMNEVKAYLNAGVLPAVAQAEFTRRLDESDFALPPGYSLAFGGEALERNDAVGNLLASVGVLLVMMVATLVLSFGSFRMAGVIAVIAVLSAGPGLGALWCFGFPFGFMAIIGAMGLVGVAINDSIVVLAAIREDKLARTGDRAAVLDVVMRATRHVVATTLTTIAGFIPLLTGGGGFWPPLAIAIAGGVGGATILALYFAPSAYILVMCRGKCIEDATLAQSVSSRPALSPLR
jgi:multidrug efflux pump